MCCKKFSRMQSWVLVNVVLAILVAPVAGSTIVIDDGTSGYSDSGTDDWAPTPIQYKTVDSDWSTGLGAGAWAQWDPTGQAGFTPGEYYVQVSWGIWDVHTTDACYTLHTNSGDTDTIINQQQFAAQSSIPGFTSTKNGDASGWYTLGKFTLDNDSYVQLTSESGGYLAADAVRFSPVAGSHAEGDGLIIDELSGKAAFSLESGGWDNNNTAAADSITYASNYSSTPGTSFVVYTPGYEGAADLSLSWGAYPGYHSTNASYLIDLDGDQGTTSDQTLFSFNEQTLADGSTPPATATWSGWYYAGQFNLTSASTITVTNLDDASHLTTDGLLITPVTVPEPSIMLLLFSMIGLWLIRRRFK